MDKTILSMLRCAVFGVVLLLTVSNSLSADSTISFSSLIEQTYSLDTLHQPPLSKAAMFSSYDRTKGNLDDTGYLRKEGEWFVIAETDGPGAILRIWAADPKGMIRIYLDDGGSPVIQQNFADLFSGSASPFEKPFVHTFGNNPKGGWSYIPIPFGSFCKVLVSELTYYQIECALYPAGTEVQSFQYPISSADQKALDQAKKQFAPNNSLPFKPTKALKQYKSEHTVAAGETVQLASFAGPGILRGVRLNWGKGSANTGRDLLLKMYWEFEKYPSVVAPVHDFFGSRMQTLALGREKGGTRYCYFPMPFQKNARIVIENGHALKSLPIEATFYVETTESLPDDLRLFHAFWTRENDTHSALLDTQDPTTNPPCNPNSNFFALSTKGNGHLIGLTLYRSQSWESDTMLFVDGSHWPPTLPGTGMEGFFDMAKTVETVNWPLVGGMRDFEDVNCLTRLFIPNPISFEQGISVTLEHGSANTLRKDISATTYWYQAEPHQKLPWILPPKARHFRQTVLPQPHYEFFEESAVPVPRMYEAENLPVETIGGHYEPGDMLPHGPDWSKNQHIFFRAFGQGSRIRFLYPRIEYSGWYQLEAQLTMIPDGGIADLQINGGDMLTDVLFYAEEPTLKRLLSRRYVFLHASDLPKIDLLVRDKQPHSVGYSLGIDCFGLYPTQMRAEELTAHGPFGLPGDPDRPSPRWLETLEGTRLLLGYQVADATESLVQTLQSTNNAQFTFGPLLKEPNMPEALFFVSWKVSAEKAGIYRLEIEPSTNTPFLLRELGGSIKALKRTVLVNDIIIKGDDTVRYDPVNKTILPYRFRVPLKEGENTIGWLLRCNPETAIQPRLFGIQPN